MRVKRLYETVPFTVHGSVGSVLVSVHLHPVQCPGPLMAKNGSKSEAVPSLINSRHPPDREDRDRCEGSDSDHFSIHATSLTLCRLSCLFGHPVSIGLCTHGTVKSDRIQGAHVLILALLLTCWVTLNLSLSLPQPFTDSNWQQ